MENNKNITFESKAESIKTGVESIRESIKQLKSNLIEIKSAFLNKKAALEKSEAEKIAAAKEAEKEAAKVVEEKVVEENAPIVEEQKPVVEETPIVEDIKVEDKPQDEVVVETVKIEEPAPAPVAQDSIKKEDKKKSKPILPKYENEKIVENENGVVKRFYVPDAAPEKPKMTTRDFGPAGYRQKRAQDPQQKPANSQPRPQGQGRPSIPGKDNVSAPPTQNFIAKKDTKGSSNQKFKNENQGKFDDKAAQNKRALMKKGYIVDDSVDYDENGEEIVRSHRQFKQKSQSQSQRLVIDHAVISTDPVSIKTLSEKIGKTGAEIIRVLFSLGIMKTMNDSITFDEAEIVAGEFNVTLEYKPEVTKEQTLTQIIEDDDLEELENLEDRPPIVTIMGHVDHGKTSLLDYIRKTNVTSKEAGGITQAIGAYTIKLNNKPITFIDTPGHELFTSMRARGAQVTDIVVLVVAADDGIMPQTIESIDHAKQANVPIIVAVNKIDKPGANPDRVLSQLTEHGLTPEDWGGETPVVPVSAKLGTNVETLLENILTLAELKELKANPNRKARGTIIEAKLDQKLGKVATILVQTGTLKVGDYVVAGECTGKIRAMVDDKGKNLKKAGPSIPVSVTGWDEIPEAGDRIDVVDDEKFAKQLAEERRLKREASKSLRTGNTLADILNMSVNGDKKELNLLVKADVQGSVEAVKVALEKLSTEEVKINVIHAAAGGINESDVLLAETSKGIIIGFNVRPDTKAKVLAKNRDVEIRFYDIVYKMTEEIELAIKGMLAPVLQEEVYGSAEVREIFKISGVGNIAGSHVVDGKFIRAGQGRVVRNGAVIFTGKVASLKHLKDDVKEMAKGFDCGIMLENFQDIKVGDIIESFDMVEKKDESQN